MMKDTPGGTPTIATPEIATLTPPAFRGELREKNCRRCRMTKELSAFRMNPRMRDGRSSWCADCHSAATQRWRKANQNQVIAYNEARRIVSPEGYRRVCAVCSTSFVARRRDAKICGAGRCKRAVEDQGKGVRMQASGPEMLTAPEMRAILDAATNCPLCLTELTDERGATNKKHLDHIVPLAVGGLHTAENVRVLCARCNLARPKDGSDLWQ